MVIARASDKWLLATQPSPFRLLVAKVGFGAGRAVPNAKLSDREGLIAVIRSDGADDAGGHSPGPGSLALGRPLADD
jgi:hypothetical protein